MRHPLLRITLGQAMGAITITAIALACIVAGLRWYLCPHIRITVFNESSTPIYALRVGFMGGERSAEEVKPRSVAETVIQSGGDAGIYFSYRDSKGILKKVEPLYCESGNRGLVELHITNDGERLVNGIYAFDTLSVWSVRVRESGQMVVR